MNREDKGGEDKGVKSLLFTFRLCQISQPEIGRLVGGIDYSAVSRTRKRLNKKLMSELKLRKTFDKLNEKLLKCKE